ncbi:MAG: bifunctional phosphoribosylaminoimidazolecarboxamide formyltransferase/IMP cyclohydrolase, partial [Planctomycetota bacterium]|nr:bifunctional phosphoribosylaminoimidazolecarboxamide formyltransferase/IMP cyclohydrolase [Planctomycetota bacterium]
MNDLHPVKRALLSVYDKTGLVELGQALAARGVELLSTGGSARALREAGLEVKDVAEETGFPEMMDGRVKTLHPRIHGALLGRRDVDAEVMSEHGIAGIDLVVCNLYPFEATVKTPGVTFPEVIEQIDIGGPSMVRSAAKNHRWVAIVTDAAQYAELLADLEAHDGSTSMGLRRKLAAAAYARTGAYDGAIGRWF